MGLHDMTKRKMAIFGLSAAFGLAAPPALHWAQGNLSPVLADDNTRTDAIVVFTGGEGRIERGEQLYADGMARQLMISGVGTETPTMKFVQSSLSPLAGIYLDHKSENTIQNASNTAKWVRAENIQSLRLVTSEDHMSRAYFELRRLLPSTVEIYADPLPGDQRLREMDNENNRLLCRTYETTVGVTFCYGVRRMLRDFGLR